MFLVILYRMTATDKQETHDSLLMRLTDPRDREAWEEVADTYRPLIYRVARRRGLQDADAQNVAQEVLQKVAAAVQKWDQKPAGGFRRWLATVARNAAIDWLRKARRDTPAGGTSAQLALQKLEAADDPEAELRRELEREAFRRAARKVRDDFAPDTWRAFWETMVEGRRPADLAAEMGKSVGAIYTARSRVMCRIKEEVNKDTLST